MKVGLVAVHYPRDAYRDELIDVFKRAAQVMRQTPGCLGTECWVNSADGSIVTTGRWESDEALDASFAAAGASIAQDERESRPRDIVKLVEV
jgi:quinol monooxygenase YgiN